ncbi:MAG: 50S ribosomal protein L2 [Candidatus Absconditabacteria bacterium]
MGVKTYKPYTPSRRFMTGYDFSDITKTEPEKNLCKFIKSKAGRNNQGRITSRFRGAGHKRLYRIIDFKGYDKLNVPAKVSAIEYDPYRTGRIALLSFADGEKRYVLAWKNIKVGDVITTGDQAKLTSGNRKQLKDIPEGYSVFNLEYTPFSAGKIIRSAGTYATLSGKDENEKIVYVKMPSGEVRKFNENCWATIGQIGNEDHKNIVIGKAGRSRWLGRKPKVLGKSMNPVDHPHGGGEGHTDIGLVYPKAFNGRPVPAGKKTRKSNKRSDKFIVSRRKK